MNHIQVNHRRMAYVLCWLFLVTIFGFALLFLVLLCLSSKNAVMIEQHVLQPKLASYQFVYQNDIHTVYWSKNGILNGKHLIASPFSTSDSLSLKNKKYNTHTDIIFIAVKTSAKFHRSRLDVILQTWFNLAKKQIWFFTDRDDIRLQELTAGHLINTKCTSSHNRSALCCKMAAELLTFIKTSNSKWFCHFDDDNYVNVPALKRTLQGYDAQQQFYLGKPSIPTPLEILDRRTNGLKNILAPHKKVSFWFATGGAGLCLSRALVQRMVPLISDGGFVAVGDKIRLPDDVTLGYIVEHLLNVPLTIVDTFHSHLEPLKLISDESLHQQISFSYTTKNSKGPKNVLNIQNSVKEQSVQDEEEDPTRFIALHCYLFPAFSHKLCQQN